LGDTVFVLIRGWSPICF